MFVLDPHHKVLRRLGMPSSAAAVARAAEALGEGRPGPAYNCGDMGCVAPLGAGRVIKVTTDLYEVNAAALAYKDRRFDGFARVDTPPALVWTNVMHNTSSGEPMPVWAYVREDITPVDTDTLGPLRLAFKDLRWAAEFRNVPKYRRELTRLEEGAPGIVAFARRLLKKRLLLADTHSANLGRRPNGDLVFFDGRVFDLDEERDRLANTITSSSSSPTPRRQNPARTARSLRSRGYELSLRVSWDKRGEGILEATVSSDHRTVATCAAVKYIGDDQAFYVRHARADHGWGPLVYDLVMEAATELGYGLAPDPRGTGQDARAVWDRYLTRPDVATSPRTARDQIVWIGRTDVQHGFPPAAGHVWRPSTLLFRKRPALLLRLRRSKPSWFRETHVHAPSFVPPAPARLQNPLGMLQWATFLMGIFHLGREVHTHIKNHLEQSRVDEVRGRKKNPIEPGAGTLAVGTRVFHGSSSGSSFRVPRCRAWFTDDIGTAAWYAELYHPSAKGTPRVVEYEVIASPRLLTWTPDEWVDLLALRTWVLGTDEPSTVPEVADALCAKDLDGWLGLPKRQGAWHPGAGSDVLLCHPDRWLRFVREIPADAVDDLRGEGMPRKPRR